MSFPLSYAPVDTAELIVALWANASRPPAGSPAFTTALLAGQPDLEALAYALVSSGSRIIEFDYINGRAIKVHIDHGRKLIVEAYYDRDNGEGALLRIVQQLQAKAAATSAGSTGATNG